VDLLAQKRSLFAPKQLLGELITQATGGSELGQLMDLGILAGIAMLVVWAVATFMFEAPGWVHLLLSAGMFLIIYRIVVRGTPGVDTTIKKD